MLARALPLLFVFALTALAAPVPEPANAAASPELGARKLFTGLIDALAGVKNIASNECFDSLEECQVSASA